MGVVALKNIRCERAATAGYCRPRSHAYAVRSYTAQVLAKSCKLVPVMIAGTLLHGKRYSGAEYAAALLIAAGIVAFALVKNSGAVNAKLAAPHTAYGYLLVFANLWLDAYTNAAQDRVRVRKGGKVLHCSNADRCSLRRSRSTTRS